MTSNVPQRSVLGKVLFNTFSKDRNSGTEFTLRKFAETSRLYSAVDMPEGWNAIQRDQNKLEKGSVPSSQTSKRPSAGVAPGS